MSRQPPSPWHGLDMDARHAGHHEPDRCAVCAPIIASAAWAYGAAQAGDVAAVLPLTSNTRPGRDGYHHEDPTT